MLPYIEIVHAPFLLKQNVKSPENNDPTLYLLYPCKGGVADLS